MTIITFTADDENPDCGRCNHINDSEDLCVKFGIIPIDAEQWRTGLVDVKKGKYIIQINGEYYKW